MRLTLTVACVAILSLPALAGDCPKPKRLTCERLRELEAQRCPPEPACGECTDCPACADCPGPTVERVEVPGPERIIYQDVYKPAEAKGKWLAGAGVIYFHQVGLTAFGGYQWANGWQLVGGPTWIPQYGGDPINGVATNGCVKIPYTVPGQPAAGAWGAQAAVLKAW